MPKRTQLTSSELLKRSEALRQQAEDLKRKEVSGVVARINEAIAYYGLRASDLQFATSASLVTSAKAPKAKTAKVKKAGTKKGSVIKYRDAAGHSWSGYGPRPKWLKDALASGASEESLKP